MSPDINYKLFKSFLMTVFLLLTFNSFKAKSQVNIGNQIWTSENCTFSNYRNGDHIPQVQDPTIWKTLTTGAWCWYNNDSINFWRYGKLYNWYAVNDIRGFAPLGWHIASNSEWNILINYLDANADTTCTLCSQSASAGGALKEAGTMNWWSPNTGASNSSGFTALPGGYRGINGNFGFINNLGYWWTADEADSLNAWGRLLLNDASIVYRSYYDKIDGFSVRLIKDNLTSAVIQPSFSSTKFSFLFYPNPASDNFIIDYGPNYTRLNGYSIRITNLLGQTVYNNPVIAQITNIQLTPPTWVNGTYVVQFINPQGTVLETKRIIIQ